MPWLERLDHHHEIFPWDVPQMKMKPSEYFKRQCWISFDPDEIDAALHRREPARAAPTASSGRATTRIPTRRSPAWSDELRAAMTGLAEAAQGRILGLNAVDLYRLPEPAAH